jgi:hypothetical protein
MLVESRAGERGSAVVANTDAHDGGAQPAVRAIQRRATSGSVQTVARDALAQIGGAR